LAVRDVDASEAFYKDTLGLRHLYRFGDLTYFDCAGVCLFIEKAKENSVIGRGSPIYFSCPDIVLAVRELKRRHVVFAHEPRLIVKMEDQRSVDGLLRGPGRKHAGIDAGGAERLRASSITSKGFRLVSASCRPLNVP
jgi:methylmalonyl-CoA/ethylmalonyl-CoA epimerase